MNKYFFYGLILYLLAYPNISSIAQNDEFNPAEIEVSYFENPAVQNGLESMGTDGNLYKIVNTDTVKGFFIQKGGEWLRHGACYIFNGGDIEIKSIYAFGEKDGLYEKYLYQSGGKVIYRRYYKN
ncbi:MAG: hypothetical protein AAF242_19715, partial [Bacteroidota bacterium]